MAYRDDLVAAHIRIAELESELEETKSRVRPKARRLDWVLVGVAFSTVLLGVGASQVLHASEKLEEYDVRQLSQRLITREAELIESREECRVAFELIADATAKEQRARSEVPTVEIPSASPSPLATERGTASERASKSEPSTSDPFLEERNAVWAEVTVVADRPSRVGVDGAVLYQWTPTTIRLTPGQHAISVIANDGRVRKQILHARRGQPSKVVVRFDR